MSRPSEVLTAAVGTIVGAAAILLDDLFGIALSARSIGALTILVSWVALGVTWFVSRRQDAGQWTSGPTGRVSFTPPPPPG